jgi:hypothetical protein
VLARLGCLVAAIGCLVSFASAQAPSRAGDAAGCALIDGPGDRVGTVALAERIDPASAPRPANDSERLLFRQLYETLVRVDCDGRARPGLAASWSPWQLDPSGRTWILTLRENARFTDGTPVAAADVLSGWAEAGGGTGLNARVTRHVESALALDNRTLSVTLRGDRTDTPLALADADLAVAKRVADSPWPIGSRAAAIAPDQAPAGSAARSVITLTIAASDAQPSASGTAPSSIRFLIVPGGDARDFLDEDVDLLITRDAGGLDYAATLPSFISIPLAWQKVHVFVSPWRGRSRPPIGDAARRALAEDGVRGEARGAEEPFWWQSLPNCDVRSAGQPAQQAPATGRIVYERGADAARDLAERLVGLARAPGPGSAALFDALLAGSPAQTYRQAVGLTGAALNTAQERGADAGYIMTLDRAPLDPCQTLRALTDRLEWLDPETIVPLVDTRLRAVVRRGRAGITREGDGGLVLP